MTLRVLIVDDHEVVRRGVREFLDAEQGISVVGEAATAAGALELISTIRPDVALVDMRLPDGDGVELCRRVRENSPATRCLILSAYVDDRLLARALSAGAVDYVVKGHRGSSWLGRSGKRRAVAASSIPRSPGWSSTGCAAGQVRMRACPSLRTESTSSWT